MCENNRALSASFHKKVSRTRTSIAVGSHHRQLSGAIDGLMKLVSVAAKPRPSAADRER
jgi:hypothetical protein